MEVNKIFNIDNVLGMANLPDKSINCILTDPPYLYLKNQKLERDFDEKKFFSECKRILKDDGFLVFFGRGTSFYRWNTICEDLGFNFKEEVIWDKSHTSSPVTPINRQHETIAMWAKDKAILKKVRVPYLEQKKHNLDSIISDIKRITSALKNPNAFLELESYIQEQKIAHNQFRKKRGYQTTLGGNFFDKNRAVQTAQSICKGMKEKSIISINRDHFNTIHPTQKPVRLFERLLALTTNPGDLVLDPFSGSASTAIACFNTERNYIGYEIDTEYYQQSIERLNALQKTLLFEATN